MNLSLNTIFSSLNAHQREAVETIYGPVLVIAGPGSGKTQLLSARIAYILQNTDYLPYNILCLTFTENAAINMRKRLAGMIGADAYKVAIHTFHSFGNEILNRFRYKFHQYDEAKVVDDIVASKILDNILTKLPWNDPYKPGYRASEMIGTIRSEIQNLKSGGVTATIFRSIIEQNIREMSQISEQILPYLFRIELLGNKQTEKAQKIHIFHEMTYVVKEMYKNKNMNGGYDSLGTTFVAGLEYACAQDAGDGKIGFISNWKKSWISSNGKGGLILKESEKIDKLQSLLGIYEAYEAELISGGYIDFSDMILRAIELVESDAVVRATLAETYQCIMIDEFQDTNTAQLRLITSIVSVNPENPNIFAVGDDDQSIYKFQGANIKNLRDFHDSFPETKVILLESNYRSYSEIIQASRSVLREDQSALSLIFPNISKNFRAARGNGGKVEKHVFANELEEISWIVRDIEKKIQSGAHPQDIAIIVKKNKSIELIGKMLLEKNIPISMSKSESIFEDDLIVLIKNMLLYIDSLQGVYEEENNALLLDILSHPAFGVNRITLWKISKIAYHARSAENKSWIELLRSHENHKIREIAGFFIELSIMARQSRLEDIIDIITGAANLMLPSEDEGAVDTMQTTLFPDEGKATLLSPLYQYFFGESLGSERCTKHAMHLANLKKFIELVRSYKQGKPLLLIKDAIELVILIETYGIHIETSHIMGNETNSVHCITVHKAKGLEWKYVYVPFLVEGEYKRGRNSYSILPRNLPLEAEKDDNTDINRLVYTACTRSENELFLSWSEVSLSEKANVLLSCFSGDDDWIRSKDVRDDKDITRVLTMSTKSIISLPYLGEERDFLQDRISKQFVMSATSLQNFLDVSSGGPEQFVAHNILRFPQAKNIAAEYGSAIHGALEDFFRDFSSKGTFIKSLLYESFEKRFRMAGFPDVKEREYLTRGKENLEFLYSEITRRNYGIVELEYDFRSRYGGIFLNDIQLTGKIDRIEILDEGTIIITDYKTGKGFDSLHGSVSSEYDKIKQWKYHLQLIFYAILFELSPQWRSYKKREFHLFFVEKDEKEQKFHQITTFIQQGEIERMKQLIRTVMDLIQSNKFPDVSGYPKTLDGIRMFEEDLINNKFLV